MISLGASYCRSPQFWSEGLAGKVVSWKLEAAAWDLAVLRIFAGVCCDSILRKAAQVMDWRRHDALGDLRVLTDDIICRILGMLEIQDVARLSCASR